MTLTVTSVGAGGATRRYAVDEVLSPNGRELIKVEANQWIKRLRHVEYDGQTMRERFTFRGDSLWWFTEIYLHKTRVLERAIETLLVLEAVCERDRTSTLVIDSTDQVVHHAAAAFAASRPVAVDVRGSAHRDRRDRLRGLAVAPTALLSRLRRRASNPRGHARVAAFVHTAFWRDEAQASAGGRESYVGPVLDEIARRMGRGELATIGLGPRRNFRSRRWWDPLMGRTASLAITPIEALASAADLRESLALWRRRSALAETLVSGTAIRANASWRTYDLWPVLSTVLRQAALVQWPWSARSMDEARAALRALGPDVAVTYAEAGGWGRALVLEARRAGVRSVGLQHGFIYRHWLNYTHEADEMEARGDDRGFPHPDATLLFDGFAAETLLTSGHFPERALEVTGSPRLDELAARVQAVGAGRADLRRSLGVEADGRLVVVAAKFAEIASDLPALLQAIDRFPDARAVVAPHPAEPADVYHALLGRSERTAMAPAGVDLGSLMAVADVLVTKNSTAAIDAMALGVPAMVVGLPNNLSPFVDAGVMMGARPDGIGLVLENVLYDRAARERLINRGQAFAERHRMRADGGSAARAAEAVLGGLVTGRLGNSGDRST